MAPTLNQELELDPRGAKRALLDAEIHALRHELMRQQDNFAGTTDGEFQLNTFLGEVCHDVLSVLVIMDAYS